MSALQEEVSARMNRAMGAFVDAASEEGMTVWEYVAALVCLLEASHEVFRDDEVYRQQQLRSLYARARDRLVLMLREEEN